MDILQNNTYDLYKALELTIYLKSSEILSALAAEPPA